MNSTSEITKMIRTKETDVSTAIAKTENQLAEVNEKLEELHLATQKGELIDQASATSQVETEKFAAGKSLNLLNALPRRIRAAIPPASRPPPRYDYSSLPNGWIRLLRLEPHPDAKAPIRCHLIDHHLVDSGEGLHLFEALSYVWGSLENQQVVYVGKGCLRITYNLFGLVARLRDRARERILWVDAVCINQESILERSSQVRMMAKIYARASRVIVWLGRSTACIDSLT